MKLFGYKLVKQDEYDVLYKAFQRDIKFVEAHRWLSEFDWFLLPFWEYIFQPNYFGGVDYLRTQLRVRLNTKLYNAEEEIKQARKKASKKQKT